MRLSGSERESMTASPVTASPGTASPVMTKRSLRWVRHLSGDLGDGTDVSGMSTPTSSVFFGGWPSKGHLMKSELSDLLSAGGLSSVSGSRLDLDELSGFDNVSDEVAATDLQRVWIADEQDVWTLGYSCGAGRYVNMRGEFLDDLHVRAVHVCLDNDLLNHDDAVDMQNLHEAPVLDLIRRRFDKNEIFTAVGGDVLLIAVNPCTPLPSVFSADCLRSAYASGAYEQKYRPHVYAIADATFRTLMKVKEPQSILFSGESGAGKTESCKFVLRYLAYENGRNKRTAEGCAPNVFKNIEERIVQTNPVLEAFGNAKTHLNLNSSRFGKFIQLVYTEDGFILGARLKTFLLEKSRVVDPPKDERGFHIFYQLSQGADQAEREEYQLLPAEEYQYLRQSECISVNGLDDAKDFANTKRAMEKVGFSADEMTELFRLVSGVMRCGNIQFEECGNDGQLRVTDVSHIKAASSLLQMDADAMLKALTQRIINAGSETIISFYSVSQAESMRDGMAKAIYTEIFGYIRQRINEILMRVDVRNESSIDDESLSLWLLDLAGFEILPKNSLEQLFVNYTNESLQGQFHERIATVERSAYRDEGIEWSKLEYNPRENLARVAALEGRDGVLDTLDEEGRVPGGSDRGFREKILRARPKSKVNILGTRYCGPDEFLFHHFAGTVKYDVEGMIKKNKDFLHSNVDDLISQSRSEVLSRLFKGPGRQKIVKRALFTKRTIWSELRAQVAELTAILKKTTPRYVRCIKPNDTLRPEVFDSQKVLHQLKCSGVLEYIKVRRHGLPVRITYDDFANRFRVLAPPEDFFANSARSLSEDIMQYVSKTAGDVNARESESWAFGKTKVFLSDGLHKLIEQERLDKVQAALIFAQNKLRMFIAREDFEWKLCSARKIRPQVKTLILSQKYEKQKTCTMLLQTRLRTLAASSEYQEMLKSEETICASFRQWVALKEARRRETAAAILRSSHAYFKSHTRLIHYRLEKIESDDAVAQILSVMRKFAACKRFADKRNAVCNISNRWRQTRAKNTLLDLEDKVNHLQSTLRRSLARRDRCAVLNGSQVLQSATRVHRDFQQYVEYEMYKFLGSGLI